MLFNLDGVIIAFLSSLVIKGMSFAIRYIFVWLRANDGRYGLKFSFRCFLDPTHNRSKRQVHWLVDRRSFQTRGHPFQSSGRSNFPFDATMFRLCHLDSTAQCTDSIAKTIHFLLYKNKFIRILKLRIAEI